MPCMTSAPQDKERVPLLPVGGETSSVAESPESAQQDIFVIPIFEWRVSLPTAVRGGCLIGGVDGVLTTFIDGARTLYTMHD